MEYKFTENEFKQRVGGMIWLYSNGAWKDIDAKNLEQIADNIETVPEEREYGYAAMIDGNELNVSDARNLRDCESYIDYDLGVIYLLFDSSIDEFVIQK